MIKSRTIMAAGTNARDEHVAFLEQKLSQSLISAIFIPFKGINPDTSTESKSPSVPVGVIASLDPASKLEKILNFLPQQQDVVRKKMIYIIFDQIEDLKRKARKELDQLKFQEGLNFSKEEKEKERIEMEEMFRRIRVPDRQDKNYELQPDKSFMENFWRLPEKQGKDADGDIHMSGDTLGYNVPRTARQIKDQLAQDMQTLVKCGMRELERYDRHCRSVLQPYESSMARRTTGVHANHASTTSLRSSPRINTVGSQDANTGPASRLSISNDVGRLSNGMPVSMERHPARQIESLGELMRRSNK